MHRSFHVNGVGHGAGKPDTSSSASPIARKLSRDTQPVPRMAEEGKAIWPGAKVVHFFGHIA